MTGQLAGKTALVTGASRGIGRGIAQRLARDGARVAVHYGSSTEEARKTVELIEAAGGQAFSLRSEFGKPGDAETLWSAFDEQASEVDVLVNNAGTSAPVPGSIDDVGPADFDRLVAINLKAPFYVTKLALERMRDGGRVINVTSASAYMAHPRQIVYSMAKAALMQFTQSLAWGDLALRGITVNAVAPGFVETELSSWHKDVATRQRLATLNTARRLGVPADVADVVAFLATDDSRFINGQSLDVSGGLMLGGPALTLQEPWAPAGSAPPGSAPPGSAPPGSAAPG
ncbi:SDR family oxidoreductase [Streptomyces sp. NBC_01498]|uniref:SDR family NAD(P)-dependent oxidoreductase n=1 Tax=Streptomyces sp. NBC_01498 TaxID=2975870 RepID=UPI002E7B01FF|nr:SDR family oxidoreductase [Streptomyces sp. NBC_01498]WTL23130.1 SDR family oxidoreductase [Streptomyces sp. NBC_01498]